MNKKLLTTSVFLATSIAMAFEPWIGSKTPTPYFVNTELAKETNTAAGYWFVNNTDEGDGGKSKVVWPVATGNELNNNSLDPIIDFCKGVCGTASLDKGTMTYLPFVSVGFNVVGEGVKGYPVPGDASSWGGICITYRSDAAPSLELGLGDVDAQIGYALPAKNLNKSKNGESYRTCIPWSDFKQPAWYREATKISGTEAAAKLVSINFKMQGSSGQYKFNICAIGPYGEKIEGEELPTGAKSLPTTCPKVLTMHPEISVSAKWSKGDDGYDATITVKDGEKELTEGTDYEIESNVNDATGIVIKTITGKGDYAGSVVKSLVPYIDENGVEQTVTDYTVLTSDVTDYIENGVINLPGGWYVVEGEVKYTNQVKFSGDAHLILADGAEMVIESEDESGIYASNNLTIYGQSMQSDQSGTLKVKATGSGSFGINSYGDITISGGKVTATGNSEGIDSDGNITISGGTVEAKGTGDYGIRSSGTVEIKDGRVTATGNIEGINSYGDITISGGTVEATGNSEGIYGYKGVTIIGGTVEAKGTGDNGHGIDSRGNITISGGKVTATGNSEGIDSEGNITISGGTVEAKGTGDNGIRSSGTVEIKDGRVTATGNSEGIDSEGNITISGGTVEAKSTGDYGIYSYGDITISGGKVTATGNDGIYGYNNVTISGGTVTVTGSNYGIYGCNNVTISGGTVTATSNDGIYGYKGVTIIGGTVTVIGSNYGIESYNNVTISGGTVTATGNDGIGIYSKEGNITLSWTNSTDFIYASSYDSKNGVSIAKGKLLKDEDDKVYSGTLSAQAIDGKTLVPPSFEGKFLSDVNIAVADIPVQKYADGKPVCPSVLVTDGKDTLKAGTDYTVTCVNNTAVTSANLDEAAIAQITGKGNYAGAIQKRFFIWENIGNYAAVQVYKDADGKVHAEIDGAYDGTDAVAIDEDVAVESVVFNREFTVNLENGGFSTIMLPFDVSASNLTGVKSILKFNDVDNNAVEVNYVWCNATIGQQESGKGNPDCNDLSVELKAYTPYMVEMDTTTLGINGKVTLKSSNNATNSVVSKSNWVFRGALKKKDFSKKDQAIQKGIIWAFAGSARNGASIGKFVQFGGNNWVNPFRAYLVDCTKYPDASECKDDEPQPEPSFVSRYRFADVFAPASSAENSLSAKVPMRVAASETASLNSMDIVIVYGDKDSTGGKEHTTVIGRMNPATGEIRMLPRTKQTYDLKGRRVNEDRKAKGAYYKK